MPRWQAVQRTFVAPSRRASHKLQRVFELTGLSAQRRICPSHKWSSLRDACRPWSLQKSIAPRFSQESTVSLIISLNRASSRAHIRSRKLSAAFCIQLKRLRNRCRSNPCANSAVISSMACHISFGPKFTAQQQQISFIGEDT